MIFSASINTHLLGQICSINEDTSGETSVLVYEQFYDEIENRYPKNILRLIRYYSLSSGLFDFLDSLTADDVYNLQEVIFCEWDETLVNTQTVSDFAIVKNFIDRAYTAIKIKHVWKNDQFIDLLNCLESSSLALSSIKRIYLRLTDKEQSKRRRIADILQKSSIYFTRIGHHQITFDVNVELPSQQTITINDEQQNVTFADLSELRDRARLEHSSNVNKRKIPQADSERDKEKLRNFTRFTSIVESTIGILTNLYTAGHPSISDKNIFMY
ncbi:unnamed protein product [Didymodactylos carnosus]|uniref:Uncharacterized protein n=1 Tax=Didymodactylos carnosus TaxID=1234261 RepID=A0A8S2DZX1_9BILA|nr:unnamed protein product [Didymodactylos carnosus]CAF3845516.1 unnamed protein product [Didymodactylos carnosus]